MHRGLTTSAGILRRLWLRHRRCAHAAARIAKTSAWVSEAVAVVVKAALRSAHGLADSSTALTAAKGVVKLPHKRVRIEGTFDQLSFVPCGVVNKKPILVSRFLVEFVQ